MREPTHRIVFHVTPKHASWLNQIEVWFSILARKIIRRGLFEQPFPETLYESLPDSLTQPILDTQPRHVAELGLVGGDQRQPVD